MALNSAGSAMEENEKHLDSIAGKISLFQAAFQSLSTTMANSEFVSFFVEAGTVIVSTIDKIVKSLDILDVAVLGALGTSIGIFTKNLD